MINPLSKRLILNPAPPVEEVSGARTGEVRTGDAVPAEVLEQRLRKLDHEWDVERLTAAVAGLFLLLGLQLVSHGGEQWLGLPVLVAACLLLQALAGWTPVLPLLRVLGFRTSREIACAKHTVEYARSDVRMVSLATEGENDNVLSRVVTESGNPAVQPEAFAGTTAAGKDEPRDALA